MPAPPGLGPLAAEDPASPSLCGPSPTIYSVGPQSISIANECCSTSGEKKKRQRSNAHPFYMPASRAIRNYFSSLITIFTENDAHACWSASQGSRFSSINGRCSKPRPPGVLAEACVNTWMQTQRLAVIQGRQRRFHPRTSTLCFFFFGFFFLFSSLLLPFVALSL